MYFLLRNKIITTRVGITDLENRKSVKLINPRVWMKPVVFRGREKTRRKGPLRKAHRNQ